MPPSFYFILASINNSVSSTIADSAASHQSGEENSVSKVGHLNTDTSLGVEQVNVQQVVSRPLAPHGLPVEPSEFFFRPVVISTISWTGAFSYVDVNAFKEWINNPVVLAHLQGISRARFNLRIRVEFSTNPYAMGKASVVFCPGVTATLAASFPQSSYVVASSRPGVEIDAAVAGAKEFVIPWHLVADSVNTTESGNLDQCFVLRFQNAYYTRVDGAAGDSTVIISAWPEQLWLWGPSRVPAVAQSYSGPIETRARRTASILSSLAAVPVVGAYAAVGSSVAGAVGNVASLFGWSRPHMPDEVRPVTVRQGNLGLTDGHDTASQVSMTLAAARAPEFNDVGINADECAIASMAGRSAFIASFAMATTDVVGTSIGTLHVTPTLAVRTIAGPPAQWALPPVAWVSFPFRRWRGTLKYTFKVVCSAFHNGAINISYEPNVSGALSAATTFSSLESCTLDVRPGSEATIHVRWSNSLSWLPIDDFPTEAGSTPASGESNGRLILTVARTLETSGTAPIVVFCYVSAGDDFQLFDVKEDFPMWGDRSVRTAAAAQSLVSTFTGASAECYFGGEPFASAELTAKSAGERVLSIRSLLKRYNYVGNIRATSDVSAGSLAPKMIYTPLPMSPPGYDISSLTGCSAVAWTTISDPYRYFRAGFAGQSGSVRYRIVDGCPVRTSDGNQCYPASYSVAQSSLVSLETAAYLYNEQALPRNGLVLSEGDKDEAGDFRICDAIPWRYLPVGMELPYIASSTDRVYPVLSIVKPVHTATTAYHSVFFSVGDDFSFYYFMGGRQVYLYS